VLSGGGFSVTYARNISESKIFSADTRSIMNSVPYVGMASWMFLAILSIYGCWSSWVARPRLVAVYFWTLLAHYIFDLGILAATFFVVLNSGNVGKKACMDRAVASGFSNVEGLCPSELSMGAYLFLIALTSWKIIATYTTFVISTYMRSLYKRSRDAESGDIKQQPRGYAGKGIGSTQNWSKFDD